MVVIVYGGFLVIFILVFYILSRRKAVSIPFWIRLFAVTLILGIIGGALRVFSLGSIDGYEFIYFEYVFSLIMNLVLLYGIFTRKSGTRLLAVMVCLVTAAIVFGELPINSPATYIALFRDIPFAAYFLFSKKAKEYFSKNVSTAENKPIFGHLKEK